MSFSLEDFCLLRTRGNLGTEGGEETPLPRNLENAESHAWPKLRSYDSLKKNFAKHKRATKNKNFEREQEGEVEDSYTQFVCDKWKFLANVPLSCTQRTRRPLCIDTKRLSHAVASKEGAFCPSEFWVQFVTKAVFSYCPSFRACKSQCLSPSSTAQISEETDTSRTLESSSTSLWDLDSEVGSVR